MHYVYLLRSVRDGGFYIGYIANLRKRFAQHAKGTSLATSHRGPWKLIYYEAYLNQEDALGRESILRVDQAGDFSKHNSNTISYKNHLLDRVAQQCRTRWVFTREALLPKRRILELYANVIEMGR